MYYLLFRFLITKFNLKTPGREEEDQEVKLYTRADVSAAKDVTSTNKNDEVSTLIVKGLGGSDNISDIDCCATRLRTTVYDVNKVLDDILIQSMQSQLLQTMVLKY